MRGILAGALVALVCAAAGRAEAQACAGGRVATPEGYCCWPDQRWDAEHQRCDGPPRCPAPLGAAGNECVGPEGATDEPAPSVPDLVRAEGAVDYGSGAASGPAPTAAQPTGEIGSSWPAAGRIPPAGPRNPRRRTRSLVGLQLAGALILGTGYAAAAVTAAFAFAHPGTSVTAWNGRWSRDSTCTDAVGATLLVPAVGGFFAWGLQQHCRVGSYRQAGGVAFRVGDRGLDGEDGWAVMGALTAGLQLVGLGLLLAGSFATTEVTVFDDGRSSLSIAPSGALGARARLTF